MANRIYVRNDLTLNKTFSSTAMNVFSAGAERVDFVNRENAAKTINTWVKYQFFVFIIYYVNLY